MQWCKFLWKAVQRADLTSAMRILRMALAMEASIPIMSNSICSSSSDTVWTENPWSMERTFQLTSSWLDYGIFNLATRGWSHLLKPLQVPCIVETRVVAWKVRTMRLQKKNAWLREEISSVKAAVLGEEGTDVGDVVLAEPYPPPHVHHLLRHRIALHFHH